jgi:hypothetical protein
VHESVSMGLFEADIELVAFLALGSDGDVYFWSGGIFGCFGPDCEEVDIGRVAEWAGEVIG